MTIARDIAKYVSSVSFSDLPKEAVHSAKRSLVDTFGCAIGAFNAEPVRIARATLKDIESRYSATLLGTHYKTDASFAAFVNGTMARYFDYNDTYDGKEFSHPSDNIFPILAVVEAQKGTGKDVILGITLAYELQCRLADAASLWKHGWDHVTYGLVSVSAVAARLMGLREEKIEQAINIALNSHITMRQVRAGELSMWKAPAFANSARNAIFAAELARNGMTGPSPVFEGENGFWKLVSGRFSLDTKKFGNRRNRFKIGQNLFKFYPAETRAQTAISCAIEAVKNVAGVDAIKRVVVETNEAGYKILGKDPEKWHPLTKETADHSLPYLVAVSLLDKDVDLSSTSERRIGDRKTLNLMKRIQVAENKKYTALFNKGGTVNAAGIRIVLKDGSSIHKEQIYSRGHPKNPMSDEELAEKFIDLSSDVMSRSRAEYILETIWKIEKMDSIDRLFSIAVLS
ncbi:MAG: MmgE/PrpD family protein [Candidatus Micrarchaeales archaeon]|nr:MmgE/PrpD family protein [Candidatus Micrarchaeales archaeon]